jgi:hypothetical protein
MINLDNICDVNALVQQRIAGKLKHERSKEKETGHHAAKEHMQQLRN